VWLYISSLGCLITVRDTVFYYFTMMILRQV
jgi:hypothetical protein